MTVEQLDTLLLFGAVVLLVSIAAVRLSVGTGLPSLLLYLALGLLLGEDALGLEFDNAELAQALGYAALMVILAEGGLTTLVAHDPAAPCRPRPRSRRSAPLSRSS